MATETRLPPVHCLQRRPATPEATGRPDDEEQAHEGAPTRLVCHRCRSTVTDGASRIAMGGAHDHRFANPHGIEFHLGCFAFATLLPFGETSTFWSWFPGFAWQIELCARCGEHLGWVFRSADAVFHGLILDRLVEVAQD